MEKFFKEYGMVFLLYLIVILGVLLLVSRIESLSVPLS